MATSNAVRGASLLTNFWKAVEEEILAAGGNEEHLGSLVTKKMRPVIRKFAQDVVASTASLVVSFADQIKAGGYDYFWGLADRPEQIKGVVAHIVERETSLDYPAVRLTTQQVYEKYGDKMADLSELLDYGMKNPETQRQFPVGIVWKDDSGQFWCAILHSDGGDRGLVVRQDHPGAPCFDSFRFLVRKPARNA